MGVLSDDAAGGVYLPPRQAWDLAAWPTGVVREIKNILMLRRQVIPDGQILGMLEEALPRGAFFQALGKGGHDGQLPRLDGDPKRPGEVRGLAIDRGRR